MGELQKMSQWSSADKLYYAGMTIFGCGVALAVYSTWFFFKSKKCVCCHKETTSYYECAMKPKDIMCLGIYTKYTFKINSKNKNVSNDGYGIV